MITSRQQRMLQLLMEARDYIPIQHWVDEFSISPRTVRHDLLQLEDWLARHGTVLERSRTCGVRLRLQPRQTELLVQKLAQPPDTVDAKERLALLLKRLLQQTSIHMGKLMDEYGISKNTLLVDLAECKRWLEERRLTLAKQRGILSVGGSEQRKRSAYLELLRAELTDDKLMRFVWDRQAERQDPYGALLWNSWFQVADARFLFDLVQRLEDLLQVQFTDAGYSTLTLHLLMAMERLKHKHAIEMESGLLQELQAHPAYRLIQLRIRPEIERHFGVALPDAEIGYITQHVLGAQKQQLPEQEELFHALAQRIIERTEEMLESPLQLTEQLVQGLAIHLKPAVYRARFGLQSNNPLLPQLEEQYGALLASLERIVNEEVAGLSVTFDRDEIGYIMLHIGSGLTPNVTYSPKRVAIVCGSGLGTSAIIERRLSVLFPQVEIAGTYSYKDSLKLRLQDADAVLTTMDIGHPLPLPWMKVSPLLTEPEQKRIAAFLGVQPAPDTVAAAAIQTVNDVLRIVERHADIRHRGELLEELLALFQGGPLHRQEEDCRLSRLLPSSAIRLQLDPADWEAAIRIGNGLLSAHGWTDAAYEERLLAMIRSQKHHFIFHEGIAFPHAYLPDHVRQTGFSLVTFKEPIPFGPAGHPVWLVITLAAVDKEKHIAALSTLLEALNEASFLGALRTASDPDKLWRLLKQKEDLCEK
ncbi:PRD domain-containing protein [Paenibacillus melissococcoides]|nr:MULTISPECIES: PRD domain-containing protein [Paenibacillus]MEB9892041.1 PRD domain-containing protein [Bacillus cereus]CAH8708632.1 PRD domain-containing protein [Paenibacillus melissococcoides]CAH8709353.1 PRD domain-containing protein [Paenibacillus melissococcoides]